MLRSKRFGVAAVLVSVMALAGCADDESSVAASVCDDSMVSYDDYVANLTKIGDDGNLKFRLLASDPAPPSRGNNDWSMQIVDMNDTPVPDVTVDSVTPFMPDHGHGTSVLPEIGTLDADAKLTVDSIDFRMPGVWTLTVEASNAQMTDLATFAFCIDG